MKIKKLLFVPALFLLASCDPAQSIFFENNTKSEATVKFALQHDAKNFGLTQQAVNDMLALKIAPSQSGGVIFGIGNWPDEEIANVASEIKSIEIETDERKIIYDSQAKIEKLFKNNRRGFFINNEIGIEIE